MDLVGSGVDGKVTYFINRGYDVFSRDLRVEPRAIVDDGKVSTQ